MIKQYALLCKNRFIILIFISQSLYSFQKAGARFGLLYAEFFLILQFSQSYADRFRFPTGGSDLEKWIARCEAKVIQNKLEVMDTTAICLCAENNMPIQVFDMNDNTALERIVKGEHVGTLVGAKSC